MANSEIANSDRGRSPLPHPEVAAKRPSKDARRRTSSPIVENPFSTFCEWAIEADEKAYSGL
jgi:hypothetical protein